MLTQLPQLAGRGREHEKRVVRKRRELWMRRCELRVRLPLRLRGGEENAGLERREPGGARGGVSRSGGGKDDAAVERRETGGDVQMMGMGAEEEGEERGGSASGGGMSRSGGGGGGGGTRGEREERARRLRARVQQIEEEMAGHMLCRLYSVYWLYW
jgi:hypothetical protein